MCRNIAEEGELGLLEAPMFMTIVYFFIVPSHIDEETPPQCVEDRKKSLSSMNGMMMIGAFVPQCGQDGNYLPIQTHGSTGASWCVHTRTGIKINGTQTERMQGKPICPSKCVTTLKSNHAFLTAIPIARFSLTKHQSKLTVIFNISMQWRIQSRGTAKFSDEIIKKTS